MLQIRVRNFDGTDPVILDKAQGKSTFQTLNSADEGIKFTLAKNDIKAYAINPKTGGYLRVWEVYDTETNTRLNYGPIESITEHETEWEIQGAGRSAFLKDYIDSMKSFYSALGTVLEAVRYENIAIEPSASTIIHDATDNPDNDTVFGTVEVNEKYHGISLNSKDNAIDDATGYIRPGEIAPVQTFYTTDNYWAGMSTQDSIVVDLGDEFDITKISLKLPWWGGIQRLTNRTYDYTLSYATSTESPTVTVQGKTIGPWHQLFDSGFNQYVGGSIFYLGTLMTDKGEGSLGYGGVPILYVAQEGTGPISLRYIRIAITDVHALKSGTLPEPDEDDDNWEYQCDPEYNGPRNNPPMDGKTISETKLAVENDCYASVVEVGAEKKILDIDPASKYLIKQRIDNNSGQIKYLHTPDASETITTTSGFRKFEPGSFFRKYTFSFSGATDNFSKFYDSDCADCYPDPFAFGIVDQNNSLIFATDNSSGTHSRKAPNYTKHVLMKGAVDATVTSCDAWPARLDPLSWGGSYSYSTVTGDYAIIHFRGQTFKWYATVPSTETAGAVSIEIRRMESDNTWSAWSVLQANFQLPDDISNEAVYHIPYESGLLEYEVTYEIRITNLGGFVSIDSIEGYWTGSFVDYNEDSDRISVRYPDKITQIYDKRYSGGSLVKWNHERQWLQFNFIGDRVIIYSAKGRHHGHLSIAIWDTTNGKKYLDNENKIMFPSGNADGDFVVNLGTGKRGNEFAQYIALDTDDQLPFGLPWSKYHVKVWSEPVEQYSTTDDEIDSNSFMSRCKNCKSPSGNQVTVNEYVYLDGISVHEAAGLSISFENQTKLDQLTSVAEATQNEWIITEDGLRFEPRLGQDTNILLREGTNTTVGWEIVDDVTEVSTMLLSTGADIDGLPLFTITEDKKNKDIIGRTIMRQQDFRSVADYFTLIGLSRGELQNRRYPEKRITVTHIGKEFDLDIGDSFLLHTKKAGVLRVRIERKERNEAGEGNIFNLECIRWAPDTSYTYLEGVMPAFGGQSDPQEPIDDEQDPEPVEPPPPAGPPPDGGVIPPPPDAGAWNLVFEEDFNTPVSEGGFLGAYSSKFSAYPTTYHDTSGNGQYDPGILSVHDSLLDIFIRTTGGVHRVAAITPIFNGSPYQRYGRYEIRMRADSMDGYKTAYLLWPQSEVWPRDGEIDFPEGDFDQTVSAFMHRQNATSGSDQDGFSTGTTYTGWHTFVIEWMPNRCEFFIDGTSIGAATSRVPNTPMRYVVQNETALDGSVPSNSVQGHVYIDYIRVWEPA